MMFVTTKGEFVARTNILMQNVANGASKSERQYEADKLFEFVIENLHLVKQHNNFIISIALKLHEFQNNDDLPSAAMHLERLDRKIHEIMQM